MINAYRPEFNNQAAARTQDFKTASAGSNIKETGEEGSIEHLEATKEDPTQIRDLSKGALLDIYA